MYKSLFTGQYTCVVPFSLLSSQPAHWDMASWSHIRGSIVALFTHCNVTYMPGLRLTDAGSLHSRYTHVMELINNFLIIADKFSHCFSDTGAPIIVSPMPPCLFCYHHLLTDLSVFVE